MRFNFIASLTTGLLLQCHHALAIRSIGQQIAILENTSLVHYPTELTQDLPVSLQSNLYLKFLMIITSQNLFIRIMIVGDPMPYQWNSIDVLSCRLA